MIVIDASAAIEVLLGTADGSTIQLRLRASGEPLAAPELIDLEVLQVLRRLVRLKTIGSRHGSAAIGLLSAWTIRRFPHRPLNDRIWALRGNLTAYDAAYVALAEALDAPLWTRDRKYQGVSGHRARVEIF